MFDIETIAPGVLAMKVAGRVGKEEMERAGEAIEISLGENEKTHIFAEVGRLEGLDGEAVAAWPKHALPILRKLDRFGRIAVVSDTGWIRLATRIESALLPYVRYEIYKTDERDRALAWVKGETEFPHGPALELIETGDPDVLAYEINGRLEAVDLDAAAACFEPAIAGGRPLRVFGRIRRFDGFDPAALLAEPYLRMKRDLLGRVERYALVGAPVWMRAAALVFAPMFGVELRFFEPDEEALAWAWLGAAPKEERALVA